MKNILKLLSVSSLLLITLWACNKDENKDFFLGGTNPVMTAKTNTGADSVSMAFADSSNTAILFSWTNPDYKFTTGISSQNVNYQLQIDSVGNNFNGANTAVISVSQDLGYNLLESQLTDIMQNTLGLAVNKSHQMEARVVSGLGTNNAVPAVSNVITFSATPYVIPPKVPLPSSGNLYLVGSATTGGWNNPVPVPSQEFTQIGPTTYQITISLTGGEEYLFLPVNGSWSNKYSCADESTQSLGGG
ncbi:MAG: SusE domain-containing protein, partial [Chitinophagaceae bacterium]